MSRNIKTLGLALTAVLAMSAFVASAAQSAPVITTSVSPVNVHATGENIGEKFTIDGVTTECKTSHYTGTVTNGSSEFTLQPTYTNCTLAGTGLTVHVNTNSCHYRFQLTKKSGGIYTLHVDIKLTALLCIVISATGTSCEVAVNPQTGLSLLDVTNDATDVTIKPNVTGIKGNVTKDGFLCPFSGTGEKTGGTYSATGGITGTAASGTLQISGE